jgi:hypothetical protein
MSTNDEVLHAGAFQKLADSGVAAVCPVIAGPADANQRRVADYTSDSADCLSWLNHRASPLEIQLLLCP